MMPSGTVTGARRGVRNERPTGVLAVGEAAVPQAQDTVGGRGPLAPEGRRPSRLLSGAGGPGLRHSLQGQRVGRGHTGR